MGVSLNRHPVLPRRLMSPFSLPSSGSLRPILCPTCSVVLLIGYWHGVHALQVSSTAVSQCSAELKPKPVAPRPSGRRRAAADDSRS